MTFAPSFVAASVKLMPVPTTVRRSSVFWPREHGSWSLALEPIALGLLIAPSESGVALALSACAAFFARRPVKALFTATSSSHCGSFLAAVLLACCAGAGLGEAAVVGGAIRLWPLLLAVPFAALFAYFDRRGDSRAVAAESAGSIAFALLPAAFATLAGWQIFAALGLATVSIVRGPPAVLIVRTYIRRRKGRSASPFVPVLAAMLGCIALGALAVLRLVPWLIVGGTLLLLVRALWFGSKWAPNWTAKRIGVAECILGLVYVALAAIAYEIQ